MCAASGRWQWWLRPRRRQIRRRSLQQRTEAGGAPADLRRAPAMPDADVVAGDAGPSSVVARMVAGGIQGDDPRSRSKVGQFAGAPDSVRGRVGGHELAPTWPEPDICPTAVTTSDAANIVLQSDGCKLLQIANSGEVETVKRSNSRVDHGVAGVPARHQVGQQRRSGCQRQLAWPPGPLTRLMMEADSVTEIELDEILQRVAAARADG